jgi:DNA-binding transcriptional regulator YiaG
MSSWSDIVKKNSISVSDEKNITVMTNTYKPLIDNNNISSNDLEKKVKKNTKSITKDKIQQIINYRSINKLNQAKFANMLSIPCVDIKNAENGNEINLTSYHKIFNYLEKVKSK